MEHESYGLALLGKEHLICLTATAMVMFVILSGTYKAQSEKWTRGVALGMSATLILGELMGRCSEFFQLGRPWPEMLPFHLCSLSCLVVMVMLVNRSRLLFHVAYFWGLGGAGMSLLTPNVHTPFPHITFINYWVSHGLVVLGVFYMMLHYRYRPTMRALLWLIPFTTAYMLLMFPVNALLDTNFLFISEKPEADSLVSLMGPWPGYVVGMEIAGIIIFFLLYSPYFIADALRKRVPETKHDAAAVQRG